MIALPIQAVIAFGVQLQGPSHSHDVFQTHAAFDDEYDTHDHEVELYVHAHSDNERHFHPMNEAGVVADDNSNLEAAAIDDGLQKPASGGLTVTLVSSPALVQSPDLRFGRIMVAAEAFSSCYPPRLERPPTALFG